MMDPAISNTRTISAADGRTLALVEVGDPNGALVLHQHGGPSSRLEVSVLDEFATQNRLRLVGIDRPGIGMSSPQDRRTFAGWADDLVVIADTLGHREFGVTGWSQGGPWALAAAAYIDPARLRHVSSIAGGSYGAFGDNSAAQHLSRIDALGGSLALRFEPGFRLMYKSLDITAKWFWHFYFNQLCRSVGEYDRQVLLRPGVENALRRSTAECFAQGAMGLVRDALVLYRSWAFDVTRIDRRVHFWQGSDDVLVPEPINKEIADRMPGASWHPVQGAGHFVAVGSGSDIFAIAAQELGA